MNVITFVIALNVQRKCCIVSVIRRCNGRWRCFGFEWEHEISAYDKV